MRPFANGPNRQLAVPVAPLVGFVGTVAGMLFAFHRIGPEWKTVLEAVGFSLGVTGIGVLGLTPSGLGSSVMLSRRTFRMFPHRVATTRALPTVVARLTCRRR